MPYPLDDHLFHLLYGRDHHDVTLGALFLSTVGGGWGLLGIAPFLFVRGVRLAASWLLATLVANAGVVYVVKALVGRGRPLTVYPDLAAVLHDSPTDGSFPSGHAAGSFCFALFVATFLLRMEPRPRYAVAGAAASVAFAVLVSASRVVLGFHFPSDVAAGALLGGTLGALAGNICAARSFGAPAE